MSETKKTRGPINEPKNHHYVPIWYQELFRDKSQTFFLFDKQAEFPVPSVKRNKAPKSIFYSENLYKWQESSKIETEYFGAFDNFFPLAVNRLLKCDYTVPPYCAANWDTKYCRHFFDFLGTQLCRTPAFFDFINHLTPAPNTREEEKIKRDALIMMMFGFRQTHKAMWADGIWEIVEAKNSRVKFIVSDVPVTLFNPSENPDEIKFGARPHLLGTRTICPLGSDHCLIITHVEKAIDFGVPDLQERINPRYSKPFAFNWDAILRGRQLSEHEVLRINLIMKRSAYRYVASTKEEFLFPENVIKTPWKRLDRRFLLSPDPRKFGISVGLIGFDSKNNITFEEDMFSRPQRQTDELTEQVRKKQQAIQKIWHEHFGPLTQPFWKPQSINVPSGPLVV